MFSFLKAHNWREGQEFAEPFKYVSSKPNGAFIVTMLVSILLPN